jgi:nitrate/nitrite transporter NarK
MRDAPGRTVPTEPLGARLAATSRLSITWQASILYAVAFGGYVAFSVYCRLTCGPLTGSSRPMRPTGWPAS